MNQWMRVCALGLMATGLGCGMFGSKGDKFTLMPGQNTPAAAGTVKVASQGKTQNREVEMKAKHLPLPSDLDPSLSTYVVWVDPPNQPATPVGEFRVNKDKEGGVNLVTPFKTFDMFVTAESTATPKKPSEFVVLQGHIDSRDLQ